MATIKRINSFPKPFNIEWKKANKRMGFSYYSKDYFFQAYSGKIPVGYTHIKINGGVGELKEIIIKEEFLGKGFGEMMIKHFMKFCAGRGCHKLTLNTSEKHTEARNLYKKHGFRIEDRKPDDRYHLTWYTYSKRLNKT